MRVVTLNTWKNEGDLTKRWHAMAAGLRELEPDLVLLQEVFRTADDAVHTGRHLAESLNLALAYSPARRKPRRWQGVEVMSESGLAVLVRGRVEARKRLELPSDEHGGERVALLVRVTVGERCVSAASIHLSHVRGDEERRREQLSCVVDDEFWREPADLRVIGGDCNAEAESLRLDQLTRDKTIRLWRWPVAESVRATHPYPARRGRVGRVIDHLFVLAPCAGLQNISSRARVALHHPIADVQPSDHAALVADIDLP